MTVPVLVRNEFDSLRADNMFKTCEKYNGFELFVEFRTSQEIGKAAEIATKLGKTTASLSAMKSRLDSRRKKLSDNPELKAAQIKKAKAVRDVLSQELEGKAPKTNGKTEGNDPDDDPGRSEIMDMVQQHKEVLNDSLDIMAGLRARIFAPDSPSASMASAYASLMKAAQSYFRDRIDHFGTLTDGVTSDYLTDMQDKLESSVDFLEAKVPELVLEYLQFLESKN